MPQPATQPPTPSSDSSSRLLRHYLHWLLLLGVLAVILVGGIAHSLSVGELSFPVWQWQRWLHLSPDSMDYLILHQLRWPRIQLAIFLGGALSVAGVVLQGIFRNPLVEPYTLGISGGAALGVATAIVAGWAQLHGGYVLPLCGFLGALLSIAVVYLLSLRSGRLHVPQMLLMGVMISFVASSGMLLLMSVAQRDDLHNILFWIMGSLQANNPSLLHALRWSSLLALLFSMLFAQSLNAMRLGEDKARHLGVNTDLVIKLLFVLSSLLTGLAVATAGVIGFVGLIVPQLMRLLVGSDFRILLPASFLGGAILLLYSDTLARSLIAPLELPIGVITGFVGGILFIVVLSRAQR